MKSNLIGLNLREASKAGTSLVTRYWNPRLITLRKASKAGTSLVTWRWQQDRKPKRVIGLGGPGK